ncbi:MutY [Desulfosarcina cetonica]|nr:MutY [Desulfosarcina cetonica]
MDTENFRRSLLGWYTAHRRRLPWRETNDPWAIWVSEVMLQQTQVVTVVPYYHRFMQHFPTPFHLSRADIQRVLKLWEGLGYYSRARNLHRAAGAVVSRHAGRVPEDPVAFRALPGVGDYICAAVLSIAFSQVIAVVDGNVKRVLARLFELDTPVNRSAAHPFFRQYADRLICHLRPGDFNQAMMELGALVCRPKHPDCAACPLADHCRAYQDRATAEYPKRDSARKVPHRHLAISVIVKKDKLLVVQREMEGFLGGLWEFPAIPMDPAGAAPGAIEAGMAETTGLTIRVVRRLTRIRHAYTHFTLSADVYLCRYVAGRVRLRQNPSHRWVSLKGLTRLPMHKANHKFIDALTAAWDEGGRASGRCAW